MAIQPPQSENLKIHWHVNCTCQMAWPSGEDSSRSHSHRCSLILPQDHDLNYVMCILVFVCCIWVIGVYLFACCCILHAYICTRVSQMITFDPSLVLLPQTTVCCSLVGKLSLTKFCMGKMTRMDFSSDLFPWRRRTLKCVREYFRKRFRELTAIERFHVTSQSRENHTAGRPFWCTVET